MDKDVVSAAQTEVCDDQPSLFRNVGLAAGHQTAIGMDRECEQCGRTFHLRRRRLSEKNKGRFCSNDCKDEARRGKPLGTPSTFSVPESTQAQRVRASGLVNMRIRRGAMERPTKCDYCHRECRTDAHHPDYTQPDLVAFLCRSHHMRAHHDKAFEATVAELVCRVPARRLLASCTKGGAA